MAENQNPNTNPDKRTQAYDQPEFNPNDTEFAQENANFNNPLATNNLQAQNSEDAEFAQEFGLSGAPEERKDARGGNNNPEGASGYTSGRVDDRGRKKSVSKKMQTKGAQDPDPDGDSAEDIARIPKMEMPTNAGTSDGQAHIQQKSADNGQPYGEGAGKVGSDNRGFDITPVQPKQTPDDVRGGDNS